MSEEDTLAIIEWVEKDNAKAKSNTDKAQSKQKKQFDANHKQPTFQWETKCGCTTRERTLNRRKAGVDCRTSMESCSSRPSAANSGKSQYMPVDVIHF